MSKLPSIAARKILRVIVNALAENRIQVDKPQTFLGYAAVHAELGLEMKGGSFGESLTNQGLGDLAKWALSQNLPAITGLIVSQSGERPFQPSPGYFKLYGKKHDDIPWWREQVNAATSYDWSPFIENDGETDLPPPKRWTRDDLLIAINVYAKLPFGQLDARTPFIIEVAQKMNRRPGSLAMKLVNLASLDPVITSTGRSGLQGASQLDREVWSEFSANRESLLIESEALLEDLFADTNSESSKAALIEIRRKDGPTDRKAEVTVRLGQNYFRQAVLANFNGRCGVTGLPVAKLLRASHIIPWNVSVERRLDPTNGLALSTLHDAAFDQGLITFDADLRLVIGKTLRDHYAREIVSDAFRRYEGSPLNLDLQESRRPCQAALAWHQERVFKN